MDPAPPPERASLVLGTAGHIDHGKTALIGALTGVDTDRLPEEKARGITIELGFAPLDLGEGLRVGVVDVPGHEGLVRTMVAGATGIDLLLLVVAADEGVMPQTREHVAICELLGISRGVVALTKADLAEDDVAELAAEEVEDLLGATRLAGAPLVRVSSVTGQGIEALRSALLAVARDAGARTPRAGPPRLPIDRSFAARGFGSVATGTLLGGAFRVGDAVEVYPVGVRGRVRGLQTHGEPRETSAGGVRCAVNVQGAAVADLARGRVLSRPGALEPTRALDVRLAWLPVAPPLEGVTSLAFLVGTAERRARMAPIGAERIAPGATGFARVHLEGEPLALLPGDAFIARGFAVTEMGGATLGGGRVLDVAPAHRRRSDPALLAELRVLDGDDRAAALRVRLRRAGFAGADPAALSRQSGLMEEALAAELAALRAAGHALPTAGATWIDGDAQGELEERLGAALDAWHRAEPLRPGMPGAALRGVLPENVPRDAADLALERLAERGEIAIEGDLARRPAHRPTLRADELTLVEKLREGAREAALDPPSLRDWSERLGARPERLRDLLAHLERSGDLVRAPGDLWFDRAAVDALRARVVAHLEERGSLDTPDYKALIGTTRRTAVPLMELFDGERVTVRRGNTRVPGRRGETR